jgi:hypothetical protein
MHARVDADVGERRVLAKASLDLVDGQQRKVSGGCEGAQKQCHPSEGQPYPSLFVPALSILIRATACASLIQTDALREPAW